MWANEIIDDAQTNLGINGYTIFDNKEREKKNTSSLIEQSIKNRYLLENIRPSWQKSFMEIVN